MDAGQEFDHTGAFCPDFVSTDELPEGTKWLLLEAFLNGDVVQSASTSDMFFQLLNRRPRSAYSQRLNRAIPSQGATSGGRVGMAPAKLAQFAVKMALAKAHWCA
ncbi:hypothetical protein [Shimia sp.]|uniref:hypothetical protein n=1 Tax=Shimia sp. TaxID=1954381 RepID=UPI0032996534